MTKSMSSSVKIVFMGTASFAVPSLELLIKSGYKILAVVTAPDKPAGRGRKIHFSPVKEAALENNIPVLQPEKLRDTGFIDELHQLKPDIQVVVAFRMLPELVWRIPRKGTFNLHASLLPQFRGAAPINHVIINGKSETGVTTFFIDEKIDTGNIIFRQSLSIGEYESAGELHDRLMVAGAELVLKTVKAIQKENIKTLQQDELIGSSEEILPAPKIFRDDCRIYWNKTTEYNFNFIRGLSPIPGAWCKVEFNDKRTKTLKIFKADKTVNSSKNVPGSFIIEKDIFKIACKDGYLFLKEVQLEGKKKMTIQEFLIGFPAKELLRML